MSAEIVFVHGLYMTGAEAAFLRRRLAHELSARTQAFHYRATAEDPDLVADRLARRIAALEGPVHLVGHSLGGLLILRALERARRRALPLPPGRVVLLGSPVAGSDAAATLLRRPVLRRALGRSGAVLAAAPAPRAGSACDGREIGVIAGSRPAGLGRFIAHFHEPNDGTVAVRETRYAGAADSIVLPVSHTGMLLSRRVALEAARFLRQGRFSLAASS
ncbi:MAG: esterase/lipase family protein [Steroidobacteraceae bacterium]